VGDGDGAGSSADPRRDAASQGCGAAFNLRARRLNAPLPALETVGTKILRRSQNPADRNEEIHL